MGGRRGEGGGRVVVLREGRGGEAELASLRNVFLRGKKGAPQGIHDGREARRALLALRGNLGVITTVTKHHTAATGRQSMEDMKQRSTAVLFFVVVPLVHTYIYTSTGTTCLFSSPFPVCFGWLFVVCFVLVAAEHD